jgi:hypothetical protein
MVKDFEKIVDGWLARRRGGFWSQSAYWELDRDRKLAEVTWLDGAELTRFFKAYLHTGCLITRDGSQDNPTI